MLCRSISRGDSAASRLAVEIVGERDWTRAPEAVFPEIVLALFVQDAVAAPRPPAGTGTAWTPSGAPPEAVLSFFRDLERLGYSMLARKAGVNERIERFSALTGAVEAGSDLGAASSPLQLSRRAAELEVSLEGENFVRLSADVQTLADRLAKLPQVKQAKLWMQPFQAYVDEQTIGPESRVLAVDEFAPLAERPLLWQGRVLHLQGNKGVRADERNDPLAEARDGHQQSLVLYQDKNVRLSSRDLNKLEPAKRPIYSASKEAAAYWLGLLSYRRGNYDTAVGWPEDRTLAQNRSSRWATGARYNLARTQEALGDNEAAIKTLQSDPKDAPQRHGNLLRAKQLAAAAKPAYEEPTADTPSADKPAADSTSATEEQE